VYVPRVRPGFAIPRAVNTWLAGICAILTALLAASLFTRSTSDDSAFSARTSSLAADPGQIAYSVARGGRDEIFLRDVETGETRRLASFPLVFGVHVRGAASPDGRVLSILHLESGGGDAAALSLVSVDEGDVRRVPGAFEYLSGMAWRADGTKLAVARHVGEGADRGVAVVEVDVRALDSATLHVFSGAIEAVPAGYTPDGRLLIVVVDQEGSALWEHGGGQTAMLTRFSPGLTRDWSLSPQGDRLAFVDHLGAGGRTAAGRVLAIATGRVTEIAAEGDQAGAVWRPGSPLPDFGGPEGTVFLSDGQPGSYLVPFAWTPDGRYLVASVVTPGHDGQLEEAVQVVSEAGRVLLSETGAARYIGLVAR
jgi:Tol biopolymer transport system component